MLKKPVIKSERTAEFGLKQNTIGNSYMLGYLQTLSMCQLFQALTTEITQAIKEH